MLGKGQFLTPRGSIAGRSRAVQSYCESYQLLLFCSAALVTEQMMTEQEIEAG